MLYSSFDPHIRDMATNIQNRRFNHRFIPPPVKLSGSFNPLDTLDKTRVCRLIDRLLPYTALILI